MSAACGLVHAMAELTLMSPAPVVCTPEPEATPDVVCSMTLVPVLRPPRCAQEEWVPVSEHYVAEVPVALSDLHPIAVP